MAEELGLDSLSDDLEGMLLSWSNAAAICTHWNGNRRYQGYILDIEDGLLLNIDDLDECHSDCTHYD